MVTWNFSSWILCFVKNDKKSFNKKQGLPDGSAVKNLPAVMETEETWVQSLGQENPLEEEMATHSITPVILPGKSCGQKSLVDYSPYGCKESDMTEHGTEIRNNKLITYIKHYYKWHW